MKKGIRYQVSGIREREVRFGRSVIPSVSTERRNCPAVIPSEGVRGDGTRDLESRARCDRHKANSGGRRRLLGSALATAFVLFLAVGTTGVAFGQQQPSAPPANATAVVGPPAGQPLSGAALDSRTKEVASLLRCPVCQGLSVWDSPATMAVNMKHEVRELLAKGYQQDQILRYFEHSYGEFVLLEPPKKGFNLLVWLLPIAFLIAGGLIVWRMMSRAPAADESKAAETVAESSKENLPGRDTLPEDPELARHVLAVRELAYGWDGGVSPAANSEDEGDR